MYYRRPKRKNIYSYFTPFLIILLLFCAVFFGWRSLNNFFIDGNKNTSNEKVFLSIDSGSAKAMTVGKSEWQNAPDKIYLYRDEKIKTGADGRLTLTFFDNSTMRLDTESEVSFSSLKKKNETYNIGVELKKGNVWSKTIHITNPNSTFQISTDVISIDANGAEFAVNYPGTVYVIDGNVKVNIKDGEKIIKTFSVGVGQQFIVNKTDIESIKKGEIAKVIYAINDTFKGTNWYKWNLDQSNKSSTEDKVTSSSNNIATSTDDSNASTSTSSDTTTDTDTTTTSSKTIYKNPIYIGKSAFLNYTDSVTNKSIINLSGALDTNKIKAIYVNKEKATITQRSGSGAPLGNYNKRWLVSSIKLKEGKNSIKIDAEDLTGLKTSKSITITYDKTPPKTPVITKPNVKDGGVFKLTDVMQAIEGNLDKDTHYVIVNDYQLQQYKSGSKTFLYYAKTVIGNLKLGKNEYKIYAKDKAGNLSKPVTIILQLDQKIIDAAKEKTSSKSSAADDKASEVKATSSGGVKITSPNNGKNLTTTKTEFDIKGIVPKGTAKVMVNDYTLSLFKPDDTTFSYKAYASMKSLTIGQKNTY